MELSARNQLKGRVISVKSGTVMAEVQVGVEAGTVVAAITDGSRLGMNLAEGDEVTVIIKATGVMIGK
ncbi:MAG: TOBE domain-containing protein [Candidatus Dormibacteraeota bacterium]|uniref:TOBE domain-containing protein n=1 Tax=Candidatus Dormiibacter inghamiae TaxID=3127013 RepID=A0A934NEB9_9BACT|nr:TOBE domain-containing protein [Candidatus Dormibacteraeota bacterium]MBJ7607193.1 TOBE domain-containing protein [Candidatus Dormibacteraeota bacterium]